MDLLQSLRPGQFILVWRKMIMSYVGFWGCFSLCTMQLRSEMVWIKLNWERKRPHVLFLILLIFRHMVLDKLTSFEFRSLHLYTPFKLNYGGIIYSVKDKDVYVLYLKGQTDGIILDWRRMCGSHAFCELLKFPWGLVTCCVPSRSSESLVMVINMTPLNKATLSTQRNPRKKTTQNLSLISRYFVWL